MCASGCATTSDTLLVPKTEAGSVIFTTKSAADGILGYEAVEVTVKQDGNDLTDVACTLDGSGYSAEFTAPATLNLPSYGPETKPVRLSCAAADGAYQQVFPVKNLSAEKRTSNAVATGILLSPLVGGAMAASANQTKAGDAFGYGDLALKIK